MKNEIKLFIYIALVVGTFFGAFVFFINDMINYSILCLSFTLICIILLFIYIFTKKDDYSVYMRTLKKILKVYDSDIVYANEEYIANEKDVLFVTSLDDLIKAANECESPLIYYAEEHASTFMVKGDDILLVYILKENDETISDYEHYLLKHIENTTGSKKVVLNNITEETIIKLGDRFYKVTPMKNQYGMSYF